MIFGLRFGFRLAQVGPTLSRYLNRSHLGRTQSKSKAQNRHSPHRAAKSEISSHIHSNSTILLNSRTNDVSLLQSFRDQSARNKEDGRWKHQHIQTPTHASTNTCNNQSMQAPIHTSTNRCKHQYMQHQYVKHQTQEGLPVLVPVGPAPPSHSSLLRIQYVLFSSFYYHFFILIFSL